jgi:hypothetical protein
MRSKRSILDVPMGETDVINFFVRIKRENAEFLKKQAKQRKLSLSKYMDAVFDNMRKL